jgi:hypothetical protein
MWSLSKMADVQNGVDSFWQTLYHMRQDRWKHQDNYEDKRLET